MTKGEFRPKTRTVRAIWFDGTNKDEVGEFIGAPENHRGGDNTTVWVGEGVHLMAYPHHWIVEKDKGWQMEGSDFERDYEPVPQPGLNEGYPFGKLDPDNVIDRAIVEAWNKGASDA